MPRRTDRAAEITTLPEMLVPSPIERAMPSVSDSDWSQLPGPIQTSLPIAIRASPARRTGGWMTERGPNSAKAPPARSENPFPQARWASRYEPSENRPTRRLKLMFPW